MQGVGFDLLVVCGFAFDPHVGARRRQALRQADACSPARMNPDLAMGDELLKKTGAGNLFMVFGEPDVDIRATATASSTVEIRGVDVYDPTTGADPLSRRPTTSPAGSSTPTTTARASSSATPTSPAPTTPTTSSNAPCAPTSTKPGRRSTRTSPARSPPETGKIAVKVINHYGDEVLKVLVV